MELTILKEDIETADYKVVTDCPITRALHRAGLNHLFHHQGGIYNRRTFSVVLHDSYYDSYYSNTAMDRLTKKVIAMCKGAGQRLEFWADIESMEPATFTVDLPLENV